MPSSPHLPSQIFEHQRHPATRAAAPATTWDAARATAGYPTSSAPKGKNGAVAEPLPTRCSVSARRRATRNSGGEPLSPSFHIQNPFSDVRRFWGVSAAAARPYAGGDVDINVCRQSWREFR
jgi:hypothetical protein